MISVYSLIRTTKKTLMTGVWRGGDDTTPEDCIEVEGRNGKVETHYWVVKGYQEAPKVGQKCLCKKEEYREE